MLAAMSLDNLMKSGRGIAQLEVTMSRKFGQQSSEIMEMVQALAVARSV